MVELLEQSSVLCKQKGRRFDPVTSTSFFLIANTHRIYLYPISQFGPNCVCAVPPTRVPRR